MEQTYNGWTNWSTWQFQIWLTNEWDAYSYCLQSVQKQIDEDTGEMHVIGMTNEDYFKQLLINCIGIKTPDDASIEDANIEELLQHFIEDAVEDLQIN